MLLFLVERALQSMLLLVRTCVWFVCYILVRIRSLVEAILHGVSKLLLQSPSPSPSPPDNPRAPRHSQGHEDSTSSRRLQEVINVMARLPLEEFVTNETLHTCTVSVLLQMVKHRYVAINKNSLLEKSDLVQAIRERRNYGVTCSICCENFERGDPLRVLPACRHEFHVECFDKWAYTIGQKPHSTVAVLTCPNCKKTVV